MASAISVVQVLVLLKQIEFTNTQSRAARVSPYTIGHQATMDAYLCLIHLGMGVAAAQVLFNAFACVAFFKFVIFAILEMRYLLVIWKARYPHEFNNGWQAMRAQLCVLYLRFYGVLVLGMVLMYHLQSYMHILLFVFYSFWIPQIIQNAIHNQRMALHSHYIIGITASRLAIPLYLYGCPDKFVHLKPDPMLCILLVLYSLAQVLILFWQSHSGGRIIIPQRFQPERYDYFRPLPHSECEDCAICMSTIEGSNDYMVTPCDHTFHANCLQQWLDQKLECPICRRNLPPLD